MAKIRLPFKFKQIEEDYNPEYDMETNHPPVTWAEMALYEAIMILVARIEALETLTGEESDWLTENLPATTGARTDHEPIK